MAEYLIPNYKMKELGKKLQHIKNKGVDITFNILESDVAVPAPELGRNVVIDCSKVEVSGEYKINGWIFVATIEHASPENIIRLADTSFEGRIPEHYRTAGKECEHCHIKRDRSDTYLIYNEDEDEFKQVGKTCLKSYTNGLDSEVCAIYASVMSEINRLSNLANQEIFNDDLEMLRSVAKLESTIVKKKAYKYVENHGYLPGDTPNNFRIDLTREELPEASDAEIEAVENYLENLPANDWSRNALATWTKKYFESRDAGLITSAVASYFKERNKRAEQARNLQALDNSYAGNIGDKVTLTVEEVAIAYWRNPGVYNAEAYPVYRIKGTDNKVYLWACSTGVEVFPGDRLTGTIKRLNERPNGEKQTELTRCKVI